MSFVQNVDTNGKKKPDVAFLVFMPLKQRRKDNSFDGNDNVGAKVITATVEQAGIPVGYCSPETAKNYRLVLVSLTSTYDVYAFYKAVALLPSWQRGKRTFKVLAGGFGMQNPTSIRHFLDYAAFGRAEEWIVSVVKEILGGGAPKAHPSLMALPDLAPVAMHQSGALYEGSIDGQPYKETFTGCPLKCKFCHYTYARKYQDTRETRGSYVQESLTGGGTPELTWDQLFTYGKKLGRVRVALDGCSERLRWLYGKKISNDDIVDGLNTVGQYEGTTVVLAYNIGNFPSETQADREEMYQTLRRIQPSSRVILVLHTTPFRPSLATPMQWEPVALHPAWSQWRQQVIDEKPTFRAVHSFTLETPWSHLLSVVAERARPEDDTMFHALAFSSSFADGKRADHKVRLALRHFDMDHVLRSYALDEPLPAWFLRGYLPNEQLQKIAKKMRSEIALSSQPGWAPVGSSLVQWRLRGGSRDAKINGKKTCQEG